MEMVNMQLQIFVLLVVGWLFGRKSSLGEQGRTAVNELAMNLVLPCAIAHSFQMKLTKEILQSTVAVLVMSIVIQTVMYFVSRWMWRGIRSEAKRINLSYATLVNNAGTLGMVIAQAAFGQEGMLYSAIYMIPVRILMWSYGVSAYSGAKKEGNRWKVLLHPCLIGIYCGLALMVLESMGGALPEFLQMSLNTLAACNTPLCMILIGLILSEVRSGLKPVKLDGIYVVLRLIILPLIMLGVVWFLPVPLLAKAICVLETAMPAPVTMAMLAQKYKRDPLFASRMVMYSTLGSMVTLPVWSWLLNVFF